MPCENRRPSVRRPGPHELRPASGAGVATRSRVPAAHPCLRCSQGRRCAPPDACRFTGMAQEAPLRFAAGPEYAAEDCAPSARCARRARLRVPDRPTKVGPKGRPLIARPCHWVSRLGSPLPTNAPPGVGAISHSAV